MTTGSAAVRKTRKRIGQQRASNDDSASEASSAPSSSGVVARPLARRHQHPTTAQQFRARERNHPDR